MHHTTPIVLALRQGFEVCGGETLATQRLASGRDVTEVEPGAFLLETRRVTMQVRPSRASKNMNLVHSASDRAALVEGVNTTLITAGFRQISR